MVFRDTIPKAAPRLKTKDDLNNISPATLRNAISGIPFLMEDALDNVLYQALSNTTSQPDTTLKVSMKRLVGESVKNWLSFAEFQSILRAMIGDILQSEICMPKNAEVIIDSQQSIGPVAQLVKTEIEKNLEKSKNGKIAVGDIRKPKTA